MRRFVFVALAFLCLVSAVGFGVSGSKTHTTDPLTGLPLPSATDSRLHVDTEPTRLEDAELCKSKMQSDVYSVTDSRVNEVVAWYAAQLPGFRKAHAFASGRSQDMFFNESGTITVEVLGRPGKDGENTEAHSVVYRRFQPGLSAKVLLSLNQKRIVCGS